MSGIVVDTPAFRVYFYTHMEMQNPRTFTPIRSLRSRAHLSLVPPLNRRAGGSTEGSERRYDSPRQGLLRAIAPEHVERFLNKLHGESLLIAALAYDLGVRLSQLRFLRIRDVNLSSHEILLADGLRRIPTALFDDLRDHISDQVSSSPLDPKSGRREQLLFSSSAFEVVLLECAAFFRVQEEMKGSSSTHRQPRARDSFLRVMGWFHAKRAARKGVSVGSPLALFDKGPRIVRRDRSGSIHSYYLWRAVC